MTSYRDCACRDPRPASPPPAPDAGLRLSGGRNREQGTEPGARNQKWVLGVGLQQDLLWGGAGGAAEVVHQVALVLLLLDLFDETAVEAGEME